jgi:hypothetical protein
VPLPTPGLAASIVPPCSSTRVRAIASPSPIRGGARWWDRPG